MNLFIVITISLIILFLMALLISALWNWNRERLWNKEVARWRKKRRTTYLQEEDWDHPLDKQAWLEQVQDQYKRKKEEEAEAALAGEADDE